MTMAPAATCEPGFLGASPVVDGCDTGTIVSPGVISGEDAPPLDLSPTPSSGSTPVITPAPAPTGTGTSGASSQMGPNKAVYETMRPAGEATTARRPAADRGIQTAAADPLADLPTLNAPTSLEEDAGGVAPEADAVRRSETGAQTEPPAPSAPAADGSDFVATPAEGTLSLTPGIASFTVVEPRLAAGSLPDAKGWRWLAEQGYRTAVDLRPAEEHRAEDLAAINASGLRSVSLPTADAAIDDPAHLARFAAEVAQESARPIYVFDGDGRRAAVLWYLHLAVNQKASREEAARAASAIGPKDAALWARADARLDALKPAAPAPTTAAPTSPAPEPPTVPAPEREGATTPLLKPASFKAPAPDPRGVGDPSGWKPYAALAAAGVGVPLAFFGRTALSRAAWSLASLPAPERRPRAIAHASDE
jgi:protein tyrosine phosphatase (PTP) superfamily phosphohydrolase (DUF442 family)